MRDLAREVTELDPSPGPSARSRGPEHASRRVGHVGGTADGASRLGSTITGTLAALLGVAVPVAWILGSYLRIDISTVLSTSGDDGWCTLGQEGIGVHCWGDFSAIRFSSFNSTPSGPEAVYPLASRLVRLPFLALSDIAGFQAALITFVVVSALCVLSPLIWAVRRTPWAAKPVVVTVAGVATAPAIMLLDRGNILALTVPLMLLALLGLVRDSPWMVAVATIAASSIKPQLVLIGVGLLALHHWRAAAVTFLGSGAVLTAPYFVLGDHWYTGLTEWLQAASRWSANQPLSTIWPNNISLPHVLYLVAHTGPWHSLSVVRGSVDRDYLVASAAIGAVVVAVIALSGRKLPRLASGVALLALACVCSPLTYAYYGVFMLPVFAIVYRYGVEDWPRETRLDRTMPVLLASAVVLGLSPLIIPLGGSPTASLLPVLSTGAWAIYLGALSVWGFSRMRMDDSGAQPDTGTEA